MNDFSTQCISWCFVCCCFVLKERRNISIYYVALDLDSPREFGPLALYFCNCNVSYFEYCTKSVLNRHKSHLIYFKHRTKIFRRSNLRFLDWRIPSKFMTYNFLVYGFISMILECARTEKRISLHKYLLLGIGICSDS